MFLKLVLLFTLIPLAEIYILMKLGAHFGIGTTLFIVIGTGVLGAYLARLEGYRVLFRIQQETRTGHMPTEGLIDAALIFVAGVVLLTPGLITDILGFFVLIPPTRAICKRWIVRKIKQAMERSQGFTNIQYHIKDDD